ncbi:MAG: hypothetical protein IT447_10115 [Phycisphaerales bacterium]|nr:hypothetical protein [Phycisphaerales bacterium]
MKQIRIFASFVPLLMVAIGCATPGASLRLSSAQSNTQYLQNFDQAFIGQDANGDIQVVLIDESSPLPLGSNQAIISPASTPPLRQVVYLHLFWRPLSGVKADHPSAVNASIDWYITPCGDNRGSDWLHYQGAAYVSVHGSGDSRTLNVRNATLKPVEIRGRMTDPIGNATLLGNITALNDTARVNQILADIRSPQSEPAQSSANIANARLGPHPNPPAP